MIVRGVGVFGKIQTQRDFVRIQTADLMAIGADRWLSEAATAMKRAGASLPAETHMLYAAGSTVLVGTMIASADAVGREHPLLLYTALDAGQAARSLAALPIACGPFLMQAAAHARRAAKMDFNAWCAGLSALIVPSALDWSRAETQASRALSETPCAGLHTLLGGGQHYALDSVLRACAGLRNHDPPTRTSATLDCPVAVETDRVFWLDLCAKLLRWRTPPSLLWSLGAGAKVLVALGPLPNAGLTYLTQPDARDDRLWPLRASRPEAVAAASGRLTEPVRRAVDMPTTPLSTLVSVASA